MISNLNGFILLIFRLNEIEKINDTIDSTTPKRVKLIEDFQEKEKTSQLNTLRKNKKLSNK